jgi:hypothetical protein
MFVVEVDIMKFRNILILLAIVMVLAAGTSAVSAQEWVKLGEKDVDFKIDHDTVGAESKGKIREIHLKVANAPIKFTRVVINYKDGVKQELEYLEDVKVGEESRSITIDGDGHVIKTIDFWYETDSLSGKKAKVTVYGRG